MTIGKPMGAGHPVAAVVTTPAIVARFAERRNYFNTFGGNPVSAAVALAVLDVIADEDLLTNSATTGALLGAGLADLATRHDMIGNVQGSGLFWGLDLVADRATREPVAYADAKRLASGLRNARHPRRCDRPLHQRAQVAAAVGVPTRCTSSCCWQPSTTCWRRSSYTEATTFGHSAPSGDGHQS